MVSLLAVGLCVRVPPSDALDLALFVLDALRGPVGRLKFFD
jgi:hypothetical protein